MSGRLDDSHPHSDRLTAADQTESTLTHPREVADSTPPTGTRQPAYFPVLPRYQYLEPVGHGAMGQVVRARDLQLKRDVAVKFLLRPHDAPPWVVARFAREARILAQLDHPNVVPVYDSGEASGFLYFVMKLVPGGSLARQAGAVCPDARRVAAVMRKVALGVQHVHEKEVLHRDLKPGNILVDADGEPLVVDFGVAHWDDGQPSTGGQAMLGTPAYMAPEVWRHGSKDCGPPTDVWSLGVTLYELLAGERPFPGERHDPQLAQAILTAPPPPLRDRPKAVPDIDDALEAIVLKCLAKTPADRYPSAAEVANDLGRWLGDEPRLIAPLEVLRRAATAVAPEDLPTTVTNPPAPVKRRRWPRAVGVGVVLAVVGLLLAPVLWSKPPKKKTLAERLVNPGDSVEFVDADGKLLEWVGEELPGFATEGSATAGPGGYLELKSTGIYLLELGNEPLPFPHEFEWEVRWSRTALAPATCGGYVARRTHPQPNGDTLHAAFVSGFDALVAPQGLSGKWAGQVQGYATAAVITPKDRSGVAFRTFFSPHPLPEDPPQKDEPGPFHAQAIRGLPGGFQTERDDVRFRPRSLDECAERLKDVFDSDRRTISGATTGDGFGLFVFRRDCQFRNVRVTRR